MPCIRSRPAWVNQMPNDKGNHEINFTFRKDRPPEYFIDCGRCEGCRSRQRQDWGVRIYHESKEYDRTSFVTLTYDDEHCPEKISRKEIQWFIKRLRKEWHRPIRYFVTGEYGEKYGRPHYHAIIFNEDFLGGADHVSDRMYINGKLQDIWGLGQVQIAPFSIETAMYTAGYTAKKIGSSDTFSLMSRKPPIGKRWVEKYAENIRRNANVVVEGREYSIPKVYMNWLKGEQAFNELRDKLAEKVEPKNDRTLKARGINYRYAASMKKERI